MDEDDLLLEASERHVQPASSSFFEAFWREAEQRQRRAARRWRIAALALAVVAAAATSAAGVMASARGGAAAVVDQTWQCAPAPTSTGPLLGIHGSPKTRRVDAFFQLSAVQPLNNDGGDLGIGALRFDMSSPVVTWGSRNCKQVHAQPAFGSRGLVENNVYTSTFIGSFAGNCRTPPEVFIRAHVTFAHRRAATAKVIVVSAKTRKPLAYFTWAPSRVAVWLARVCDVYAYPY